MGPESPTFKSSGSYLDLSIKDTRLKITNTSNGKLKVMPYASDHNAILIKFKIDNFDKMLINFNDVIKYYNFKKKLEKILKKY